MGIQNSEDTTHFQDQAHIWKLVYGFAESLVLRGCVELGIPEIINNHGGHISLSQLASDLPYSEVNTDHLSRIMRFMVHMNLFNLQVTPEGNKLYGLEPAAELLLKDAETSMAPIVLGMIQRDFTLPWHHIKDGLTGEETAFEKAIGMTIWDYLEAHPKKSKLFNEVMAGETRLLTASLVSNCKNIFCNLESVVDVGGGNGTNLRVISMAFPHIKCTVFDLPHVIDNSSEIPGINKVAGDMFESIPRAQAIILKVSNMTRKRLTNLHKYFYASANGLLGIVMQLILHDWSDEDCVKILKKCKEAVPREGGKVIIVDVVLDGKEEHKFSKPRMVLDIDMLVNTGGRERTEDDWKALILERAGYKELKIRDIGAIQSLIEASP